MYLAHKCTKCWKADIVYFMDKSNLSCRECGHTETEEQFWQAMRSEAYLRDLEAEIEDRYPFKDIFLVGNSIDLAIGWHVLGKYENRDFCINALLEKIKNLHDKWGICYCYFDKVEKRMKRYEEISTGEDSLKYKEHLDTMRDFFTDFPEKMKNACK